MTRVASGPFSSISSLTSQREPVSCSGKAPAVPDAIVGSLVTYAGKRPNRPHLNGAASPATIPSYPWNNCESLAAVAASFADHCAMACLKSWGSWVLGR